MCVGKNTSQTASVEFLRCTQKLCAQQAASPLSENSEGIFDSKNAFHPKIRDERHTAFRGTTQIRRKALRTRFPITEDDPAAHFLAAAPGRTPQTATGQLAAGDWPSLGSREGADFPIRRFSDSNMYIYTIFFSAFQGKFLGTSTKKYRLWEKKVLYYDQVF